MAEARTLRGGCVCGRNEYTVVIPAGSINKLQVYLDNSSITSRHTTSPLTPFLRVPLDWYHSVTYAYFPDETHTSIRRTFTSPSATTESARRQFCGFCGTQLSSWNESTVDDASHISVNLGSLENEDVSLLDTWGLFDAEDDEDNYHNEREGLAAPVRSEDRSVGLSKKGIVGMRHRGTPWFEEMVQDSRLGRIKRQKGGYTSKDGNTSLQWEVVELASDGTELTADETFSPGKRKRDDEGGPVGDVHMRE